MRIGILTAGGDCPGINAAIRGVGKTAILEYGMEVIGISSGFLGLINEEYVTLDESVLSGILTLGGTILGTSRDKPFKMEKGEVFNYKPGLIKKNYEELGLDCIVCIGGNGTMKTANLLSLEGLNVIGIPKTIDKDLAGTVFTLGFDSALNNVTNVLNDLRSTAGSHGMTYFVQIMGRRAGHLTYHAGNAANVHFMTIPEIETEMDQLFSLIQDRKLQERYPGYHRDGKRYTIVAVAEGTNIRGMGEIIEDKTLDAHGNPVLGGVARYLMQEYIKATGDKNARELVLGHIPRSGPPSCQDRIRGKFAGVKALELISKDEFGRMVSLGTEKTDDVPLIDVVDKIRVLDAQICFDKLRYRPHLNSKFYHEREISK